MAVMKLAWIVYKYVYGRNGSEGFKIAELLFYEPEPGCYDKVVPIVYAEIVDNDQS